MRSFIMLMKHHYFKLPPPARFLFLFAISFIFLDRLLFGTLLWMLPDETYPESDVFYQFEYQLRSISTDKPKDEFRVVVVGSSLGIYGIMPNLIEEKLNKIKENGTNRRTVKIYPVSHLGMNGINLATLSDRILAKKPDLIILPVNMVDFRNERPLVFGITNDLHSFSKPRSEALHKLTRDLLSQSEIYTLAPYGVLKEYFFDLTWNQRSQALLSLLFYSYRYRNIFMTPLSQMYTNRFGHSRSYSFYEGIPVGGGGVTNRGYTSSRFDLPWNYILQRDGVDVEVKQEMFVEADKQEVTPLIRVAYLNDEFDVKNQSSEHLNLHKPKSHPNRWDFSRCDLMNESEFTVVKLKKGWQTLPLATLLKDAPRAEKGRICFRVEPTYRDFFFYDKFALRLGGASGVQKRDRIRKRIKRREDDLYLHASNEDYIHSFEDRTLAQKPGREYGIALKNAKIHWSSIPFDRDLPSVDGETRFRKYAFQKGVPLLIVNMPENPISLSWYKPSLWYSGYLDYLREPAALSDHQQCSIKSLKGCMVFMDASDTIRPQEFYDFHHLSYYGALHFDEQLANTIENILDKAKNESE